MIDDYSISYFNRGEFTHAHTICGHFHLNALGLWRPKARKKGLCIQEAIHHKGTISLRKLFPNRAGHVGSSRFLENPKVTIQKLVASICTETARKIKPDQHLLVVQDTSEMNFQSHSERVHGLGTVGNGKDVGFFIHPGIVMDAQDGTLLGAAAIEYWLRTKKKSKNYRDLPIEKKESMRWLNTAQQAKETLHKAPRLTIIADRESDIYEMWDRIPDARTDLLLRACRDRKVLGKAKNLWRFSDDLPVAGETFLSVKAKPGVRKARQARLEVRFGPVTLRRPLHCSDPHASESVQVFLVDVREGSETVPENEKPLHWRLLTTHKIDTITDSLQVVGWYRWRWEVEEVFRTLKKKGANVEASEVESGNGLVKLVLLAFPLVLLSVALKRVRGGEPLRPISDGFSEEEVEVMKLVMPEWEGKTEKQKNHYQEGTLSWAAWLIGRMGGWKGYASERPPGVITMYYGLQQFYQLYQNYKLIMRLRRDVCKR